MEIQQNPVTLSFHDSALETAYLNNYSKKTRLQVRIALLLAIGLFSAFAFLDPWIAPDQKYEIWLIRFAIVVPILLIFLGFTFARCLQKYMQVLMSSTVLVTGSGVSAMMVVMEGIGSFLYSEGLLLVIMCGSIFCGLRFIYATTACLGAVATYGFVDLFIKQHPLHIFITNNFFLISANIIGMFASYALESYSRRDFLNGKIIEEKRQESEALLLNILPKTIAEQLKNNAGTIAEKFDAVTILFVDIVGFTQLSEKISPEELVSLLNKIFSIFDRLTDKYGLEKIKTIGDAYMVVGGLPEPREESAEAVADFALDMQQELECFNQSNAQTFEIRVGIHTGPAVAGVIGIRKFIYDVWGDSVNTASRMESHGMPGQIQVSEATYQVLKHQYRFSTRGTIEVKGKGIMKTYFLKGKKTQSLSQKSLLLL